MLVESKIDLAPEMDIGPVCKKSFLLSFFHFFFIDPPHFYFFKHVVGS